SPAITPAQAPSNRYTSSADIAHPVRKRRSWMLGYSPAMHKFAPFIAALACGMSLLAGTARAQQAAPPLKNPAPVLVAMPGDALRSAFEAADRGNLDELALAGFASQPLAGWLEYAALRRHFDELPIARGAAFLAKHRGTPVGTAFRADWLQALAKRNEWQAFLADWDAAIESTTLRCLQLQARMALGRTDAPWTADTQAIWRSSGKSLPSECDAPFALLAAQGGLTDALRWERFDKAVDEGQSGVMRAIAKGFANAGDAALANRYAGYMAAADASAAGWPKTARSRQVASVGLARLGKAAPDRAEALLPGVAQALGFDEAQRGRVLHQVALWTVASYLPGSAQRLANVPLSSYDASLHEWQVREALSRSDWAAALAAIRRMPEAQRDD